MTIRTTETRIRAETRKLRARLRDYRNWQQGLETKLRIARDPEKRAKLTETLASVRDTIAALEARL